MTEKLKPPFRIRSTAEAYCTALAKTAGREFTFDGAMVLSDEERALLEEAERLDAADMYRNRPKTNMSD